MNEEKIFKQNFAVSTLVNYPQLVNVFANAEQLFENVEVPGIFMTISDTENYSNTNDYAKKLAGFQNLLTNKELIKKLCGVNNECELVNFDVYKKKTFDIFVNIISNTQYKNDLLNDKTCRKITELVQSILPNVRQKVNSLEINRKNSLTIHIGHYEKINNINNHKNLLKQGILIMPLVKKDFYEQDLVEEVEFISSQKRIQLLLLLLEDLNDYYKSIALSNKKIRENYSDIGKHIETVLQFLQIFTKSGIKEQLYDPIIQYIMPIEFVPINIDGFLRSILVKLRMFYKKKNPDEVLSGLKQKDELYEKKINFALQNHKEFNFDVLKEIMFYIYQNQTNLQQKRKRIQNNFLKKLRTFIIDYYAESLPRRKSSILDIYIFKKSKNQNYDFWIKSLYDLKVNFHFKNKNQITVLKISDYKMKKYNTVKNLFNSVFFYEQAIKNKINIQHINIKQYFEKYLGVKINNTDDVTNEFEYIIPYFYHIEQRIKSIKETDNKNIINNLNIDESLKFLYSLFFFTTIMYHIINKTDIDYVYLLSKEDNHFLINYIKDLYNNSGLPVQIITETTINAINNIYKSNIDKKHKFKKVNVFYKNIFLSSLKSFKNISFNAELKYCLLDDVEQVYTIVENRTSSINHNIRHHIFSVYKTIIKKEKNNVVNVKTNLIGRYLSFFRFADYFLNIFDDLTETAEQNKTEIFFLRKGSLENISVPVYLKHNINIVNVIETPLLFVQQQNPQSLSQTKEKGSISIIQEEHFNDIFIDLFKIQFGNKYTLGIAPAYVSNLVSDLVDCKFRKTFHTDLKVLSFNAYMTEKKQQSFILSVLGIMNFDAEGFGEESCFSKIDLSSIKKPLTLTLKRNNIVYKTKIDIVMFELLGQIGLGHLNQ